jgi:XTP/dITP diphosphohydrolase
MAGQVWVLATRNPDKLREIRRILSGKEWTFKSLADFPDAPDVIEDGSTFLENARKKARAAWEHTGIGAIADDSGLEVDALGGAPGVLSSRFSGENASYHENNRKLLEMLEGIPLKQRIARFRCVVVLVKGEEESWVEGAYTGMILNEPRGKGGFGYDPLFYVPSRGKTFAEMTAEEKNHLSHRGIAFRKVAELLQKGEFPPQT